MIKHDKANNAHVQTKKTWKCSYCKMNNHTDAQCGHQHPELRKPWSQRKNKKKHNERANLVHENEDSDDCDELYNVNHDQSLNVETHDSESKEEDNPSTWVIDSGASCHITGNKDLMTNLREESRTIRLPNEQALKSSTVGRVRLRVKVRGNVKVLELSDVVYVEGLKINLLSVQKLDSKGISLSIKKGKCEIRVNQDLSFASKWNVPFHFLARTVLKYSEAR